MDKGSSKKTFVSGVSVLTLSALLVKVIGLVYKIPLLHVLGAEGMGFFNAAYEIYTLFFVISTAGLPVAVSVLVSESGTRGRVKNVARIHTVSFCIFTGIGIAGTLIMALGASAFSGFLESKGAYFSILAIAPTILFVCASGALRGFFQGCQNMIPTAVSQVIEALGKLVLGLIFAIFGAKKGYSTEVCAALAVLGVSVGSLISALYLLLEKRMTRISCPMETLDLSVDRHKSILWQLMRLAIPVTLSASLAGVSRIVDMSMLLRRLQTIGYSSEIATAMYGSYSTLAVPVYHLPASLVAGISVALVPTLTAAAEEGNGAKASDLISSSIRLCTLAALPLAGGITVFARPILELLFSGEGAAIRIAELPLSLLGLSVFSSCLSAVTNSVLHAYKKASLPIVSMLAGTAVKMVSAYVLIGIPSIGMLGAPISTLLCNVVSVGFNLYYIDRETHFSASLISIMAKPLVCVLISLAAALAVYDMMGANGKIAFLISVFLCALTYLICITRSGALSIDDIRLLPGGEKMLPVLTKIKLIGR